MKKIKLFYTLVTVGVLLGGCQTSSVQYETTDSPAADEVTETAVSIDEEAGREEESDVEEDGEGKDEGTAAGAALDVSAFEKITSGGKHSYQGTLTKPIIVDSTEDVELIFDGVTMEMDTVCIFVVNGDLSLTLKGKNTLSSTSRTSAVYEEESIDAVIYTKDDLLIQGDGSLTVNAKLHGIICKDVATVSASVQVTSEKTALRGKDAIEVSDAALVLDAGTDGLKSDSDDGTITIQNSSVQITAKDKGMQAVHYIQVDRGASITIDSADDGMNCDDTIVINDGTFTITSGDDAVHANNKLTVEGGTLKLSGKECLEATLVAIKDGTIEIQAEDDGINAAQKMSGVTPEVSIAGGSITIVMAQGDTDGIDSNGNLSISGGTIDITANSPFDYDGQGSFTGGTVYVNGQQVTTLQNQMGGFGGGHGGRDGNRDGYGRGGRRGDFL